MDTSERSEHTRLARLAIFAELEETGPGCYSPVEGVVRDAVPANEGVRLLLKEQERNKETKSAETRGKFKFMRVLLSFLLGASLLEG